MKIIFNKKRIEKLGKVAHTHRLLLASFVFFFLFTLGVKVFAVAWPYAPGTELDPGCAPSIPDCTVLIFPDQTGNDGKFLQTNSGVVSWETVASGTTYTFSTGLNNASSTITNNLSTGVSGGQSVVGGTASGNDLTLSSTSNATKGKIIFGNSAYDEVNNRLGIGTTSPTTVVDISFDNNNGNAVNDTMTLRNSNNGSASYAGIVFKAGTGGKGGQIFGSLVALDAYGIVDGLTLGPLDSTQDIGFRVGTQGASNGPNVIIKASGNMGVGDATPAALFTVGSGDLFQVNSSGAIAAATGITSSGTINFSGLTASQLVATDASKNLQSLDTATYPSLTEIAYLKGVTSAVQTQLNSKEAALTFSTGLTRSTNTITNDLSTGVSGGQSVVGGTGVGENLTISSTSNGSKGQVQIGSIYFDETNSQLGIGTPTPGAYLDVFGATTQLRLAYSAIRHTTFTTDSVGDMTITPNGSDTTITGNLGVSSLTASRALTTNSSNKLASSATTDTELGYVSGVTSAIQTQLDAKGTFTLPSFTSGSVLFSNGSTIAQDNTNFFWDDSLNKLSINTSNSTGTTTSSGFALNANSLTTGIGMYVASSSLTSGSLAYFGSTSTAATGDTQTVVSISNSGATGGQTTFGLRVSNAHSNSGAGVNIGIESYASGANTASYAIKGGRDTNSYFTIGTDVSSITTFAANGSLVLGTGSSLTERARITSTGEMGIGTGSTVSAKLHVLATTEQLRLGYDVSNYLSTTVGSTGGVTFNAVGSGSAFTFSDSVSINTANSTGTTTSSGFNLNANSLTTGTGMYVASSTLTSGALIDLAVTGTAGLTNQKGLNISLSGTNGTGAQTTYGSYISNTHTGTSTNVGGYFTASGGTNNYALVVPTGGGGTGIGTSSPTGLLHVSNETDAHGIYIDDYTSAYGSVAGFYFRQARGTKASPTDIGAGQYLAEFANYGYYNGAFRLASDITSSADSMSGSVVSANLAFWTTNAAGTFADRLHISGEGAVGIGDVTPDYALDVVGDVNSDDCFREAGAQVAGTCTSDSRLKHNINSLEGSLDKILQLRPVEFEWNENLNELGGTLRYVPGRQVGLIAQEIQQVFPHLVKEKNGYLAVSYNLELQMVAIDAIQELDLKVVGIENFSTDSTFAGALISWLANASNRITRIFTGEICLVDSDGNSECLNKAELMQLKSLINSGTPTPSVNMGGGTPDVVPEDDQVIPEEEQSPVIDNTGGTPDETTGDVPVEDTNTGDGSTGSDAGSNGTGDML